MKAATARGGEIKIVTGDARDIAIDTAVLAVRKAFGQGSIMYLGEQERQSIDTISTGNIAIDVALGVGGIPRGRVTEIYGAESSGKTTLALHLIAEAQKTGGTAAIVDAEHALDPEYARNLGVDITQLLVSQPDTGEEALEVADALVRSGALDLVIIDSVAALVPKAEIEGEMGDSHMGLQARLMSQALRKLTGTIAKTNTAVVFINQIREKVGVMFGSPETTPGGRALKFYVWRQSDRTGTREREAVSGGKRGRAERDRATNTRERRRGHAAEHHEGGRRLESGCAVVVDVGGHGSTEALRHMYNVYGRVINRLAAILGKRD
jgi:recombination protein RecA